MRDFTVNTCHSPCHLRRSVGETLRNNQTGKSLFWVWKDRVASRDVTWRPLLYMFYRCGPPRLRCLSVCIQTPSRSTREGSPTRADSLAPSCSSGGNRWVLDKHETRREVNKQHWDELSNSWISRNKKKKTKKKPEAHGGRTTSPTRLPFCLRPKSRFSLFSRKLLSLP